MSTHIRYSVYLVILAFVAGWYAYPAAQKALRPGLSEEQFWAAYKARQDYYDYFTQQRWAEMDKEAQRAIADWDELQAATAKPTD